MKQSNTQLRSIQSTKLQLLDSTNVDTLACVKSLSEENLKRLRTQNTSRTWSYHWWLIIIYDATTLLTFGSLKTRLLDVNIHSLSSNVFKNIAVAESRPSLSILLAPPCRPLSFSFFKWKESPDTVWLYADPHEWWPSAPKPGRLFHWGSLRPAPFEHWPSSTKTPAALHSSKATCYEHLSFQYLKV